MSARMLGPAAGGLVFAIGLLLLGGAAPAAAQTPVANIEEQALAIERQLLCPICTNERLDVCPLEICKDMRRIIRERLEAGATPDDILLYFRARYGDKVMARVPAEGFNLVLYGWIAGSVAAVGGIGTWMLLSMRRRSRPAAEAGATAAEGAPPDDGWLDAQIAEHSDD